LRVFFAIFAVKSFLPQRTQRKAAKDAKEIQIIEIICFAISVSLLKF